MEETNLESSFIQCQVMVPQFFRVGVEGLRPSLLINHRQSLQPEASRTSKVGSMGFLGAVARILKGTYAVHSKVPYGVY